MTIKRKILTYKDFTKGKNTLENPVKHPIKESEDKSFTPREEMIKLLNQKFPNVVAKTEKFKKDDVNGIWSAAENTSFIDNAKKISAFNTTGSYSYNPKLDKYYELEVHKTLAKFLKDNGWYTEFYDDATPIFYPIYNTNESVLEKELTQDAKDFIAKKIKFLIGEGRPQKQAVAMAYSYAKKEGYDVPANESEEILDEAAGDIKFSWKEQSKSYGKQAIGYDNSLRSWECRIHGEVIARLNNSGYLANSLGGDSLNLWRVTFATKSGPSFTMSKKFEKDQLQQAKDYIENLYKRVLAADETTPDKNLLDFKAKMVFPVKQVKVAGEYKGLKKLLKEKLGKNFDYYFGTEASGRTIRYRPDFEETGNLTYAGSGAPTSELKMIQDALGEDYVVTHNARVISIRKK